MERLPEGLAGQPGRRAIGRTVIDNDELETGCALLVLDGVQNLDEPREPVAGGDDDGEFHHVLPRRWR